MEPVEPDRELVASFWAGYCAESGRTGGSYDAWSFGDSADMADRLLEIVLIGPKRATAGLLADFEGEDLPREGAFSVVCRGDGSPAAILRTTDVSTGPLTSVTDEFAWDEGEGDRSRAWWVRAHQQYCARRLAALGLPPDDDPEMVFERFDLVWPSARS